MSMSPRKFLALLKSVKKEHDGVPSPNEMRAELEEFSKRVRIADGVTAEALELKKVPCLRGAPYWRKLAERAGAAGPRSR